MACVEYCSRINLAMIGFKTRHRDMRMPGQQVGAADVNGALPVWHGKGRGLNECLPTKPNVCKILLGVGQVRARGETGGVWPFLPYPYRF